MCALAVAAAFVDVGCSLSFDVGPAVADGGGDSASQGDDSGGGTDTGGTPLNDAGDGGPDTSTPLGPPRYVSASVASPSGTHDMTVARPPGTQPGDLLLVSVYANNDTNTITPDPAAGWTVIANLPTSTCESNALWAYHIIGASDGSSYLFTGHDAPDQEALAIVAYRGADPAKPIGPTKMVTVGGNSASYTISLTTDVANELVVMMPVNDQGGSSANWTPPSGMLKRADNGSLAAFEETLATAGPTASRTATTSAADHCGAVEMVGVRPAPR